MADFAQGDLVRDYFTLVDENNDVITGATLVVGSTEDPNGDDYSLTTLEIGGGVYRVEFLAALVGTYYYRVDTVGLVNNQSWEETFNIGPMQLYGAEIGTAAYGNTLIDLTRRVATAVGDFKEAIATDLGASDGTSFQDQLRLAALPAASLKGANLTIVSPADSVNYMAESRVIDSTETTQTLTLQPPLPGQILVGDVAWMTNLHSRGFWKSQYREAINEAINESFPMHLVPVDYTYPETFWADDPTIPAPLHLTHIYAVQYYDADGWVRDIPYSDQNLRTSPGWSVEAGVIRLNGSVPANVNGMTVRLLGYGRPAELVNPGDYTTLPTSWVVPKAASILRTGTGDQKQLAVSSMLTNTADTMLVTAITQVQPGTIRIR
jgi:hypothetical protein